MFNVGLIGLGFVSDTHLKGFCNVPGVKIAAVADLDEQKIAACADNYSIGQSFQDYQELLSLQDLDLVVVCLPNNLHAPVSIEALQAGHHVLCEKPLATSLADAEAMLAAADNQQRTLSVVMNFRWQFFGPDIFFLKDLIANGELGEIYYLRVHYLRRMTFPSTGYERWNLSKEQSGGGVLIDLGPHMLDLAMWLLDDYAPAAVNGVIHNGLMKYSAVEDFASGAVTLRNGTRIQADLAWNSHNRTDWGISVYGERGGAHIDAAQPAGQRMTRFTEQNGEPAAAAVTPAEIGQPPEASLQQHVVKRMRAGERPDCSAERALQVMRVIDAWYASAAK